MHLLDGKNVYLIGFMATGKSRVGSELAGLMNRSFLDTDVLIEEQSGETISDIFAKGGERSFRSIEKNVIAQVSRYDNYVVSLGGGAVLDEDNWRFLTDSGISICLTASVEVLFKRISSKSNRPLMNTDSPIELKRRIESLLVQRRPYYSRAHFTFESTEEVSAHQLAQNIYNHLWNNL